MDFDSDQESITPHQQPYIKINTTGGFWLPAGTSAQRPSHGAGLIRYNTDTPGIEYSNGSVWTALGAGGGGSSTPSNDVVGVTWFIDSGMARILFNTTAGTVNFSASIFAVGSLPGAITGQTVYIHADNGYEGIYVLGSTSVLTAVPVTRHTDWPATRNIYVGTKIYALYSAPEDTYYVDSLDPAYVSSSTEKIGMPSFSSVPDGTLVSFVPSSGATMPGGLSAFPTFYFTNGLTTGDGFSGTNTFQVATSVGGSAVNITSTGAAGSSGYIADMVFHAPYAGDRGAEITLISGSTTGEPVWTWNSTDASLVRITYKTYSSASWSMVASPFVQGAGAAGGSIAIGENARDGGQGSMSVSIGHSAQTNTYDSVAVGGSANALNQGSTAVGRNATSLPPNGTALGIWSRVNAGANAATAIGSNTVAYNAGAIALGIRYSDLDHTQTAIERIVCRTTDNTEFAFPPFIMGDEFSYVVTGKLMATSYDSTSAAIWEIDGTLRGSASMGGTRTGDLVFRRVGGDGSAASGAFKIRYVLEEAPSYGIDGMSQLSMYFIGHPTETVVWTGYFTLSGVFNSAYTSVSAQDATKVWNVGPSVRAQASTTLTAGQFVNVYNASGTAKVRPADADAGYEATGFVLENYANTNTAIVYLSGENPYLSSLTVGPLYLSTTAGAVTSTVYSTSGTLVQQVGTAISATKMLVQIGVPVML